jgi:hypothetical protein
MLMYQRKLLAVAGLGACVVTLLVPSFSHAIPAFARQNKTECTSCHTIFPQLNEFGEAFRKNSYVYPRAAADAAAKARLAQQPTPDKAATPNLLERLTLVGIPSYAPLSADGTLNVVYNRQSTDNNDLEIALRAVRLHAGGSLADTLGFFLTYRLFSEGTFIGVGNTPANNVPDVEEAFGIWRHMLGTPVNIKAGRLQPSLSLWKASNNLIATNYASHSYRAGTLTGRSPFSLDAPENAIEVNSLIGSRAFVAAGIVDRKGQAADDGYGHFAVKFGGTDFQGNEPEVDLQSDSVWDFLHVTVGGFGYFGRNARVDNNGIALASNDFYRLGGDIDAQYNRLNLRLTGTYGRDTNLGAFGTVPAAKEETRTYAFGSELQYFFKENLVAMVRFEQQDDGTAVVRRYLPAIVYGPLPNFKVSLQYIHDDINSHSQADSTNRIALLSARLAL